MKKAILRIAFFVLTILSLFSGEVQQRKPKEQDARRDQNQNAGHRGNYLVPNHKGHAQHLLKPVNYIQRCIVEPGLDPVLHDHLPQQQRGVRRREGFDDRLHARGKLPDRDIDAGQEADDGADDCARDRERVVAAEKRNKE